MAPTTDVLERLAALAREGASFAMATVVGRRPPVSGHLGDRAIVFADGRMEGFVGGACSREIIRRQALEALRLGRARVVAIRLDPEHDSDSSPDRVVVRMTCASEGAVEVFVEPFVQPRQLVVVGMTPIASALAKVARSLDYRVTRVVEPRELGDLEAEARGSGATVAPLDSLDRVLQPGRALRDERAVVVASQGHYDEEAVETALRAGVPYVGLVASRARGAGVRALLEERGVPGLAALRNPAGLDLGARTPSEVAVSILAEIVRHDADRAAAGTASPALGDEVVDDDTRTAAAAPTPAATAVDPVCGMDVEVATARHTADIDGVRYYFCCAGCRSRFVKQPDAFRSAT